MPVKIISFERAKDPLIEAKKTEKLKAMQAAFETAWHHCQWSPGQLDFSLSEFFTSPAHKRELYGEKWALTDQDKGNMVMEHAYKYLSNSDSQCHQNDNHVIDDKGMSWTTLV